MCEVGGKPFSPVAVCHLSSKLRHKMLQRLRSREKRVHGADWPDVDEAALEYVINQASGPADRTGTRVCSTLMCVTPCDFEPETGCNILSLVSVLE